ncbi:hypothetical protein PFISCL1PPCAC_13418, partial [Pristionchus fissidentatus]
PPPRRPRRKRVPVPEPGTEPEPEGESPPSISPSSSSSPENEKESILDRMRDEYNESVQRRLPQERLIVEKYDLELIDHPSQSFYKADVTSFHELTVLAIKESVTIFRSVFSEFEHLAVEHKAMFFKSFLGKFLMAEGIYLTSIHQRDTSLFMGSLLTCIDCVNVDSWVSENDQIERKDDFRAAMRSFASEYFDMLSPMMKMDPLTEREFHALIVLAFCDVDISLDLPENVLQQAEEMRRKVFKLLQEYYKSELKLDDFSQRLGNLMTVSHNSSEAGILMNEEFRMYSTMFGIYADDDLMREIFLE